MRLTGEVAASGLDWMLVDVGGVGHRVQVSLATAARFADQSQVTIWTHEAVRDDRRELYGFVSRDDLELFWKLIGVNGVGPKVAQKILGVYDAKKLRALVMDADDAAIKKVPGVGTKTAQKIVLELRGSIDMDALDAPSNSGANEDSELIAALASLGYAGNEARDLAAAVPKEATTIEEKIKAVLKGSVTH